ncbi:ArdC-like ssDNA-binding domain-containing protein [Hoyosella sp. YIM 151337]|nr:ArdC-like ssDNA-binding domain-containing protein [Hoyosella sp. YIM 151337]MCW4356103.1 ArdC-like ssDNA-binding domain-containing protein [Hoyosella sp. YIM 151337]
MHTSPPEQPSGSPRASTKRGAQQWTAYLRFCQSFYSYSFNNVILIMSQCPHATQVAGFRKWQELGRQVRKGEKSLKIFGYRTKKYTEENPATGEEEEKRRAIFPVLSVFDISQTEPIEGHPQPEHPVQRLTGDDEHGIYSRVHDFITARGWTVTREHIDSAANGYTMMDGTQRIVIEKTLSPAQAAKTLIHETAHALMHGKDQIDRNTHHQGLREVEAESVAYVVAGMLGLDTTAYSVGYVTGWAAGDPAALRATAERVLATVKDIINALHTDSTEEPDAA